MNEQIKYAFKDIMSSKRNYIMFIFQMIIVFILVANTLGSIIAMAKGLDRTESLRMSNVYITEDSTSQEKIQKLFENMDESEKKIRELYKTILALDVDAQYTEFSYAYIEAVDGMQVEQRNVNDKFFDVFDIEIAEGNMFDGKAYSLTNREVIPIIVGYKLKEYYQIGQIYDVYDCGTGEYIKCKVIGVLKNNSSFYSINNILEEINLNYSMIKPIMVNNIDKMSFSDLDMSINNTTYFDDNILEINKVIEKSNELELFNMGVVKAKENIDEFVGLVQEDIAYKFVIATFILIFCIFGMITNLLSMILKKTREFSIHILCGARIKTIMIRIYIQILSVLLIGFIPTLILYGICIETLLTFIICLLLSGIIVIIPLMRLATLSVSQNIRRN